MFYLCADTQDLANVSEVFTIFIYNTIIYCVLLWQPSLKLILHWLSCFFKPLTATAQHIILTTMSTIYCNKYIPQKIVDYGFVDNVEMEILRMVTFMCPPVKISSCWLTRQPRNQRDLESCARQTLNNLSTTALLDNHNFDTFLCCQCTTAT